MSQFIFHDHLAWVHNEDSGLYINPLTLGSELVTNGNFDSGSTGWGFGTGWTVDFSPTRARAAASTNGTELGQTMFLTANDYYLLEFTIGSITGSAWTVVPRCAGYTHKGISGTVSGEGTKTYQIVFQAVNGGSFMTPNWLNFQAWTDGSTVITIDSVSLKHVDTYDTFRGQWANGEPWPMKGTFNRYSIDQSPWWVG